VKFELTRRLTVRLGRAFGNYDPDTESIDDAVRSKLEFLDSPLSRWDRNGSSIKKPFRGSRAVGVDGLYLSHELVGNRLLFVVFDNDRDAFRRVTDRFVTNRLELATL
jgi:hypothetical protein